MVRHLRIEFDERIGKGEELEEISEKYLANVKG